MGEATRVLAVLLVLALAAVYVHLWYLNRLRINAERYRDLARDAAWEAINITARAERHLAALREARAAAGEGNTDGQQ